MSEMEAAVSEEKPVAGADKKQTGTGKKIGSILLLLLGWALVVSQLLAALVRLSLNLSPEYGALVVAVLLGCGALWCGTKFWVRWRYGLGMISTILGALLTVSGVGVRAGGSELPRRVLVASSNAVIAIGAICVTVGILLLLWHRAAKRRERAHPSP
jgi:hypothetical protein